MVILVNVSNIRRGGAIQVALSLLHEIRLNDKYRFHIILSNCLKNRIDRSAYGHNFTFYEYEIEAGIYKGFFGKDTFLETLEKKIEPNCVFTVFGPSYWVPKSPHLIGFAQAQYIYDRLLHFPQLSFKQKVIHYLKKGIKLYNFRRKDPNYWVETSEVEKRLKSVFKLAKNKISVITNTVHPIFDNYKINEKYRFIADVECFKFVTISAYYPHKNLEILSQIIPLLKKQNVNCKFFLTLDNAAFKRLKNVEDYVVNLGPIPIEDCPTVYKFTDCLFLPTLLECFSCSYAEAMKMEMPIITSDLPFAHSICESSALYFNPLSSVDVVEKIKRIISEHELREELVANGTQQFKMFDTSRSRATKMLELCEAISV